MFYCRYRGLYLNFCPGFGQDRVNFHRTAGRGTAGRADPTWPNRAGYSIPCAVMWGSGGGELGDGNSLAAREHVVAAGGESCSLYSAVLFCVYSLSVSLLLLFPLFAVLLNCPYPDPPVSASFFPFSSAPQRGEGQQSHSKTTTHTKHRTKENYISTIHTFPDNISAGFPEAFPKWKLSKRQDHYCAPTAHAVGSDQITTQPPGSARKIAACLHYNSWPQTFILASESPHECLYNNTALFRLPL